MMKMTMSRPRVVAYLLVLTLSLAMTTVNAIAAERPLLADNSAAWENTIPHDIDNSHARVTRRGLRGSVWDVKLDLIHSNEFKDTDLQDAKKKWIVF